jgi:hypothetical protein
MNDLKIWKMVWEVRYPASASLFDNRGAIASKWQWTSDLSEWRISNNQVSVHNKNGSTFLNAGFKVSSVAMELPESTLAFCNQAVEFSSSVLDTLKVEKLERVGLRLIQIAKRKHFKLLVNKMRKSLFGLSDDDWKIFGESPVDIGFPLTLTLENASANFNLGPMRVEQLTNYFESKEIKEKLPATALFVDFDIYKNDPEFTRNNYHREFSDFLSKGTKRILEITNTLMDRYGAFE